MRADVIGPESTSKPGALPTVQSARDWLLRNAQRFPVLIDSENPEKATQLGGRVGSQVSVLVYTGDQPLLNAFGRAIMGLSSVLSCVY